MTNQQLELLRKISGHLSEARSHLETLADQFEEDTPIIDGWPDEDSPEHERMVEFRDDIEIIERIEGVIDDYIKRNELVQS